MEQRPKVGVGVLIIKDGKVLFGKRKGAHEEGTWSFPGGHLEYKESIEECAKRETLEEAGISIKNVRHGPFTNDVHEKEDKHYITCIVITDYDSGEPKIMEPDKCECWGWFSWDNLPEPLFLPVKQLVENGFNPFSESYK